MTSVLYSSDIHGNEVQYRKLIDYAIETSVDTLIIGGDLAPKTFQSLDFITGQRYFFENKFPELFTTLKQKLPNCNVYLMMGNDDCSANYDILSKNEPDLYHIIHGKRLNLTEDIDIIGYSYVPISPFGIKDWEKYDLSSVPPELEQRYIHRKRTNYRLDGVKSTHNGWRGFKFNPNVDEPNSIQKDLEDHIFSENSERTVYVFHTPPDNTNLDQILNRNFFNRFLFGNWFFLYRFLLSKEHVGSIAVRLFIEKYQPYLTLH